MKPLRYFLDTHDRNSGTFPGKLTREEFEVFFGQYQQACMAEGVVPIKLHLSYDEGRAFCLNLAEDADAVRRAHERVGLPFDGITEVTTATPGDTFFRHHPHFERSAA